MKKQLINESIDKRASTLSSASDCIWDYAETAFTEFKSVEDLCKILQSEGFEITRNVADITTAFTASFGSGRPVIGILGEFDALYNLSQKAGCASQEPIIAGDNGHGCGHNLLGVGSLAAAIATKEYLEKTHKSGTVIYFGTPGEEGGSGKTFMAREGVFDCLDVALTWHPASLTHARMSSSLANIQAAFKFKGKAAHAATAPHMGRSALDAVELMNVGVNYMREHIRPEARVHYAVTNTGGHSPNVVQPYAEVLYLCRAAEMDEAQKIYDWVCDIARGAAMMTQTEVEIDFYKAVSNQIPNRPLADLAYDNMCLFGAPQPDDEEIKLAKEIMSTYPTDLDRDISIHRSTHGDNFADALVNMQGKALCDYVMPVPSVADGGAGSTDVGDVSWICPTVNINVATHSYRCPGHTWQITAQGKSSFAHKGMLYAGKIIAGMAVDIIDNPALLEEITADFKKRTGGKKYKCPIPNGVKPRPIK